MRKNAFRRRLCWGLAALTLAGLAGISHASYPGIPEPPAAARFTLRVPAEAEVWFDGQRTSETGSERRYSSPPLDPQRRYAYDIRVRWQEDGVTVERTRRVHFHGGERVSVDFTVPAGAATARRNGAGQ
jgi:uncharacterized protein (TIGR03000 family)